MVLPDGGRSYLSKFYDDNWMIQYGFMERSSPTPAVDEVLRVKRGEETTCRISSRSSRTQKVGAAIELMQRYSISQLPVVRDGTASRSPTSSARSRSAASSTASSRIPDALNEDIAVAMQPPLAAVDVARRSTRCSRPVGPARTPSSSRRRPAGRRPDALGPARVSWRTSVASVEGMSARAAPGAARICLPRGDRGARRGPHRRRRPFPGDRLEPALRPGCRSLEQHRLVNEALAEPLRDGTIHELRIKTKGSE